MAIRLEGVAHITQLWCDCFKRCDPEERQNEPRVHLFNKLHTPLSVPQHTWTVSGNIVEQARQQPQDTPLPLQYDCQHINYSLRSVYYTEVEERWKFETKKKTGEAWEWR